jgi:hypothetical protein
MGNGSTTGLTTLETALDTLKNGDIQVDEYGNEWYILGIVHAEGKPRYSRVRVGSLAHQVIMGRR